MWHFRLVVPKALRASLGVSVIKRSLRTRDPTVARAWAYVLGARYAQIFATAAREQGGRGMSGKRWDDDAINEVLRNVAQSGGKQWEVQGPDWLIRTNGTREDHEGGLAALNALLAAPVRVATASPLPGSPVVNSQAPTLAEAIQSYSEVEAKGLKPNTWSQRRRSLAGFAEAIGGHLRVDVITRPMAANWSDGLIRADKAKGYAANCVSHVAQLFEALCLKGVVPTNPVKGLVVLKKKEKAARRSEGHEWEPFEEAQLKRIFDPANLARTRMEHVRWSALIALYTGARVGEIAQIFLRDFVMDQGTKCVLIHADSDGQGVKTGEGGERKVPLHPDLLRLGLWERVEALRAAGAERLFPAMRIDSAAGKGASVSKGFSYYLAGLGIEARREHGIIGMHSLRKNVIQMLQGSSLPEERRRALVGHEPGDPPADTHQTSYMRAWTAAELAVYFPGLPWGQWLDFKGLGPLLALVETQPRPERKRRQTPPQGGSKRQQTTA